MDGSSEWQADEIASSKRSVPNANSPSGRAIRHGCPAHSNPRNGELGPTRTDLINTLPGSGILLTRNGNKREFVPYA